MAAWAPVSARCTTRYRRLYAAQWSLVCGLSTPTCRALAATCGNLSLFIPGHHQPCLLSGHGYTQYLVDAGGVEALLSAAVCRANIGSHCVVRGPVRPWHGTPVCNDARECVVHRPY